jgi:hypothetical protein
MMPSVGPSCLVGLLFAADLNSWDRISEYVVREWPALSAKLMTWAGVVSILAAAWWMSAIYWRARSRRTINSPRRLFRELCRAHRLGLKETALLYELAELRGLETPLSLFVEEEHFAQIEDDLDAKMRREAETLRRKLFAVTAPPAESPEAASLQTVAED